MKHTIILLFLLTALNCAAQINYVEDRELDSIIGSTMNAKDDTNKVIALNGISKKLIAIDPDKAVTFGKFAIILAKRINFKRGLALAYKQTGIGYFSKGSYLDALQHYEQSLDVFKSISNKTGIANMYSNIGNVYFEQGNDSRALENYLQSLKISEEINDTLRIVTALVNIGAINALKKQTYDNAIKYFKRAMPLCIAIKDDNNLGAVAVNIGEIYREEGKYDSALYYFELSLKAVEGTEEVPYTLNDIGTVYMLQKDYDKAIEIQQRAYNVAKNIEDKYYMAISLVGLAKSYQKKGDFTNALLTFLKGEKEANETKANYTLRDIYQGLTELYSIKKDFTNAYKYQSLLLNVKDTIYNLDSDRKLGTLQFTYDLDKKESQINLLTKDQEIKEQEIKRQKIVRNSFIGGFVVVLLFAGVFFRQRNKIRIGKKRSDELLLNILPEETAEELKSTGKAKTKSFDIVTVMFTDFKNFTQASEILTPEELVEEINYCFSEFDKIISKYDIEKIKTIGDAYMCASGLPVSSPTHAEDIIKAGLEFQQFIEKNKANRKADNKIYFELRLGVHSGPVVAGVVGVKKFAYDIWGDTVNTASRMESSGEVGKVNISGTTYELVKDKFNCTYRGKVQAKNKGEIDMYFVDGMSN